MQDKVHQALNTLLFLVAFIATVGIGLWLWG
jgi:hypothetical protein